MMFDVPDCADECLGRPFMFPGMGSDKLVMKLYTDTRCTLYGKLMAVYLDMDTLTSNCMLILVLAASGLTDDIYMCILGYMIGGCIGSIALD